MKVKSASFARSLRFQITVISVLILVASVAVFIVSTRALTNQTKDLYQKRTTEQLTSFKKLFESSGELNKTFVTDYSYWDEMVTFVKTRDKDFADDNLIPSFKTFHTDDIWVYNKSGQLVYSADKQNTDKSFSAPELSLNLQQLSKWLNSSSPTIHYYTKIDGKVLEINATTIVSTKDAEHVEPASGYLLVGREISASILNTLGRETNSQVKIINPNQSTNYPTDLKVGTGKLTFKENLLGPEKQIISQVYVSYDSSAIKLVDSTLRSWLLVGLVFYSSLIIIIFFFAIFKIVRPLGIVVQALQTKNIGTMTRMSHLGNEFGQIAEALKHFFFQQNYMSQELESRAKLEQQAKQHAQDLEKLNNMMIGRELRMIELKNEIARFKEEKSSQLAATPVDNPEGQGQ